MRRPTPRRWTRPLAAVALVVGAAGGMARGPAGAGEVVDPVASLALAVAPGDRTLPGEVLTLTAEVDDAQGAPVTDGVVRFTLDGSALAEVALDGAGRASASVAPPRGAHRLVATYPGRPDLLGASAEAHHSVLPDRCADAAVPGGGATVRHLYVATVGRCPDPAGFAHWTGRLAAGTTAATVARALAGGPEARAALVDEAYRHLLGRPADPGARAHWAERLRRGEPLARLWAAVAASPELAAAAGPAGAAALLYERVLARPADTAGRAHWEARLAGARSRGAVLLAFLSTPEALGRAVDRTHRALLGRPPTPTERAAAVATARHVGDWGPLRAALLAAPELVAHAQTYPDPVTAA